MRNASLILDLHSAVGASMWQCQALEDTLVNCVVIGHKTERNSPKDLVEKIFGQTQELTLGQLAKQLEGCGDIPVDLMSRLKKFKPERNWLAHKSWLDTLPYANSASTKVLDEFLIRIELIGTEALQLNKAFGDVLEERVLRAGVSKEYLQREASEIYRRWLAG
jgi:hypothetical protein